MPKLFKHESTWDGGGGDDASDVDQWDMDNIVVEENTALSHLIARNLHKCIVSKDSAKGQVANRLELSVAEVLGSIHLDEDENEGSEVGGSSLPSIREDQHQGGRSSYSDSDSGSNYNDSDDEGEVLSVIEQDLSEPLSNNGRYEVEASEEVVMHTPESMRKSVTDMKAGERRAAQAIAARLLNTKGALDWPIDNIEFPEEGDMNDKIVNTHHLDFLSVDAMPGTNIGGDDRGNISSGKFTFCQWQKPYKSYRAFTADHSFFPHFLRIAEIDN